jgi:Cu/Ag efflux protein CusF
MQRRRLLKALAGITGLASTALVAPAFAQTGKAGKTPLEVWKDPDCGCCNDWVKHLQANGFAVRANDTGNSAARSRLGVPTALGSCHTALVAGYAIEGHVPAREIRRLLKERPQAVGLTVPGMPVGSPGMDGAIYGDRRDPFDVLLIAKDGSTQVFESYNRPPQSQAPTQGQALPTVQGEVRKVDKATGKISIRHGEIKNLDMPPMSMVFQVKDPALLDKVKAGDKVRFTADQVNGDYTVMSIEVRRD